MCNLIINVAKTFLRDVLKGGAVGVSLEKIRAKGCSHLAIDVAACQRRLNIVSVKSKGDFVGAWDWMLPLSQLPMPEGLLR